MARKYCIFVRVFDHGIMYEIHFSKTYLSKEADFEKVGSIKRQEIYTLLDHHLR